MKHVFITGCPRSGTTMLASMLGNDQSALAVPESHFFNDFINKYLTSYEASVSKAELTSFFNAHYRFKQWGINAKDLDNIPDKIMIDNFNQIIVNTVKLFANTQGKQLTEQDVIIDHTPSNIKDFDFYNKQFPEAKFIFIVRDPRAVFASVRHLDWGANTPLRLAEIWLEYAAFYFSLKTLIPDRITLVRYEDLIVNTNTQIERLCQFIGLSYSDKLSMGLGFQVPEYTQKQHKLVGTAPDKTRIDKWKDELKKKDILILESYCRTLMTAFGYEHTHTILNKITTKDRIDSIMSEILYYIPNKFKKKARENNT